MGGINHQTWGVHDIAIPRLYPNREPPTIYDQTLGEPARIQDRCTSAQYVHTSNGYAGMFCIQTHPYEIKPLVKRVEPDMNRFLSKK